MSDVSAAPELIAPTAVASTEAGGSWFVLAVFVDDVDVACTVLAQHGVVLLNRPVDRPRRMPPPASPTPPVISGRSLRISTRARQPPDLPGEPSQGSLPTGTT